MRHGRRALMALVVVVTTVATAGCGSHRPSGPGSEQAAARAILDQYPAVVAWISGPRGRPAPTGVPPTIPKLAADLEAIGRDPGAAAALEYVAMIGSSNGRLERETGGFVDWTVGYGLLSAPDSSALTVFTDLEHAQLAVTARPGGYVALPMGSAVGDVQAELSGPVLESVLARAERVASGPDRSKPPDLDRVVLISQLATLNNYWFNDHGVSDLDDPAGEGHTLANGALGKSSGSAP